MTENSKQENQEKPLSIKEFEEKLAEQKALLSPKTKAWIHAMRLRTLPLSLSGLFLGASAASMAGVFSWGIFLLSLLVGLLLQILSNFANDYGDAQKGTDGEARVGPARAVASGLISSTEMMKGIKISIALIVLSTFALLAVSFGTNIVPWITFAVLMLASIIAAIKYTMGKNPYGYSGKGDIFVFIFFGLVAVLGSYSLYGGTFFEMPILPALSAGLLSTAVLNVNNIRDMKSDALHGKNTFALYLGDEYARKYHLLLVAMAFIFWSAYLMVMHGMQSLYLLLLGAPIIFSAYKVYTGEDSKVLDTQLKITAMGTGLFHILLAILLA